MAGENSFLVDYYNLKYLRVCRYTKQRIINSVKKFKDSFEFKTRNYEITFLLYSSGKIISNHQYVRKRKQTAIRQIIKELYYEELHPLIKSLSDLAQHFKAKQELSKLPARNSNLLEILRDIGFHKFINRKSYRERVKEKVQEYYSKLLEKEKELQEMEKKRQEMLDLIQEVFCDEKNNQEESKIENEQELREVLSEQEFNIIKNIVKERVRFIKVISCNNKKVVVFDKLQITL